PWGRTVMLAMRGMRPGGRAVAFKIEAGHVEALRRWVAHRPDVLAAALKKRLRFSLPLGLFVAMTALPILGGGFDPFAFAFGPGLVVLAVVGPRYPRRGLLAFDAVLWFCLAASHARSAYEGTAWSIFFAILALLIGRQSLSAHRFY